ncbi:glutaredoxin domain-containing protein [Streptomyces sp. NPDC006879]|uniref:glutaredoxin domain-containing protein n=1 Tax=Streptomyces sp. NPDC006879 TaxID=3364767 RepID=UPI003690D968
MAENEEVVLYWRPRCPYCVKLRLILALKGLRCRKVNIWRDPEAAAVVRSVAGGYETVPTVTVAGRALVNPSVSQLMETVRAHAPHALRGASH